MIEVWVCEYSPTQGYFHVDTLDRVLESNRKTVRSGEAPGYVPLQIFLTSKEAHEFARKWEMKVLESSW